VVEQMKTHHAAAAAAADDEKVATPPQTQTQTQTTGIVVAAADEKQAAAHADVLNMPKPAAVVLHLVEPAVVVLRPPVQLQSVPSPSAAKKKDVAKKDVSSAVLDVCAALVKCALFGDDAAKQARWATLAAQCPMSKAEVHAMKTAYAAQAAALAAQAAAQAAAALVAQAKADLEAAYHAVMQELFYAQFDSVAKVRATLLELELFPLR
jgi:hypothetical protein